YGRADLREQLRNIQNIARINAARDAAFAPAGSGYPTGSIQCLINVDANPNNNDPACVPLNRLGLGVADPRAIDYVLGDPYRKQVLEQMVFGANFSFTPFATWAGDVSIAVGGEYRKWWRKPASGGEDQLILDEVALAEGKEYFSLVIGASNRWSVGNYLPSFGSYNVKEAYLETVVPLGFGLEFNGAVRATDYSQAGYVTTWKAGATWQPIDDIRLRVTRSRDIRAPNLNDLFQAGTANSDSVKGGISNFSAQAIVNLCFLGEQAFCNAISVDPARTQNPAQPYLVILTRPFNAASQEVRGVDIDASYRIPMAQGSGAFTLRGLATRYLENRLNSGVSNAVVLNTVGVNGGQFSTPKWIYRVSAAYDNDDFSLTAVGRGVSAGKYVANGIECQTTCPVSTVNAPTYERNRVKGAFYVDLNFTQKFSAFSEGSGEFFINVTNLLNGNPILLPETGLAANSTYSDLLGRSFRFGVRIKTR
ncbi:hypothetical protein A4X03_0g8713, partial [Tilletia caries]